MRPCPASSAVVVALAVACAFASTLRAAPPTWSRPTTATARTTTTTTATATTNATTTTTSATTTAPRVHDPSTILKLGDDYWCFTTGAGVRSFRSRDLRLWTPGPRAFDDVPEWTAPFTGGNDRLWAPDIIRAADGRYFLFYSASSFGKNVSAIGLATNRTLDPSDPQYRWVDQGPVVTSSRADNFNAIDPAATFDADGKLWLSFGSFWSGIKLIELDPRTGRRVAAESPVHALAHKAQIEAPFIHRRGDAYYLFVNWGWCCRGVRSTYNIRVGRSDRITGPYVDRDGKKLTDGGGTLVLESQGSVIGPGHASIVSEGGRESLAFHFYDATNNGRATLGIRPLTWSADGWPVVGEQRR